MLSNPNKLQEICHLEAMFDGMVGVDGSELMECLVGVWFGNASHTIAMPQS